ncbi:MAG: hypothetical protein ACYS8K_07830, partial [Planctomycetota bacterium]
ANPKAAWERMGRPRYLTHAQVSQLRRASIVQAEELDVRSRGKEHVVEFGLPPWGIARVTIEPAGA